MIELDWPLRHHHSVFAGIRRYADAHPRFRIVIDPFADQTLMASRSSPPYSGVIARPTEALARAAAKTGVPIVSVMVDSPAKGLPRVVPDFEAAGRVAARHLLERGYQSFGFVGFERETASRLLLAGFAGELEGVGHGCREFCVGGRNYNLEPKAWATFVADASRWIDSWAPPMGLFVSIDLLSRYLVTLLERKGLSAPNDVALVGAGNEPMYCESSDPSLSSVDMDYARVGYRAAELLSRLMKGARAPAAPVRVEPGQLVVRRSSDIYAVDDPMVADAMRYIAAHYSEEIGVADVVSHLPTTQRSLQRRFRRTLGRTIIDELMRARLDRARRLLASTDLLVKEVAAKCGFRSAKRMGRVFRQVEGVSPGDYRRRRSLG
jgi:LacI family transcriptional regulator